MKMLITGNPKYGLAEACAKHIENSDFASRANGYDLCTDEGKDKLAELSLQYDVFVNSAALYQFHQTMLLYRVFKEWKKQDKQGLIINIGSTIDWSQRAREWDYSIQKKALRDASLELAMMTTWDNTKNFRVSYISYGSLQTKNVHEKHPTRTLMPLQQAVDVIKWVAHSPSTVNVNQVSIDPIQENAE